MASQLNKLAQFVQQNPLAVTQFGAGLLSQPTIGQGVQAGLLGAMQAKQWSDQREEKKKREEALKQLLTRFPQANGPIQDLGGGVTSQDLPGPLQENQPNQYGLTQKDALMTEALGPQYLAAKLSQGTSDRKTIKGADGYNYFIDTGERVLKDVVKEPDDKKAQVLVGPNGEQVSAFPGSGKYTDLVDKGYLPLTSYSIQSPNASGLSPSKADDIQAQIDQNRQALSLADSLLQDVKDNPENFGIIGSLKKAGQEALGIAQDVGRVSGVVENGRQAIMSDINNGLVDPEEFNGVFDQSLPENEVKLQILTYALARSMQGDGKLLKDTIEQARKITKITGPISSQAVEAKIRTVKALLEANQSDLQARRGGGSQGEVQKPAKRYRMKADGSGLEEY